jgi:hypothetical protein
MLIITRHPGETILIELALRRAGPGRRPEHQWLPGSGWRRSAAGYVDLAGRGSRPAGDSG